MTWAAERIDKGALDALKRMTEDSGRVEVTRERLVCGEVHEGPLHQPPPVRIIFPKAARV